MTWESEPNAISTNEIMMEATDANSSDSSTVEYRFREISGNPGATASSPTRNQDGTIRALNGWTEVTGAGSARQIRFALGVFF